MFSHLSSSTVVPIEKVHALPISR